MDWSQAVHDKSRDTDNVVETQMIILEHASESLLLVCHTSWIFADRTSRFLYFLKHDLAFVMSLYLFASLIMSLAVFAHLMCPYISLCLNMSLDFFVFLKKL